MARNFLKKYVVRTSCWNSWLQHDYDRFSDRNFHKNIVTGYIGLVLLIVFCINAGYSGSRLGDCWAMLEERYPRFRHSTRNPYPCIAECAVGKYGRYVIYDYIFNKLKKSPPLVSSWVWFKFWLLLYWLLQLLGIGLCAADLIRR